MQKKNLNAVPLALALACILIFSACGGRTEPDPHEGMIYVNTGPAYEWLYPADGVPASNLSGDDFTVDDGIVVYHGQDYDARLGVDVSFYQGAFSTTPIALEPIIIPARINFCTTAISFSVTE